jgi:hypothetical protein
MINITKLDSFPLSKLMVLLLALFFLVPTGEALAQKKKKKKKKKPSLEVSVKLGLTYDDNILKYSDKYLERFDKREDEGRFHIETYDDAIMLTSLKLAKNYRIFGKIKSRFEGEISRRSYLVNDIKSWNYFTLGYRQYFNKKLSFKLFYSYIPEFYVRHFRDEQWIDVYGYEAISFQPYAFSKDSYGFWVQNTFLKNTRIRLSINYYQYYHNKHYTEYDSKNMGYGFNIYQPIHKKVKLEFAYQYITSDAKGYDAAYETEATSDGPDADYVEDRLTFGLNWRLPNIKKRLHYLIIKCAIQNRYYSSIHPLEIDQLHAGREDNNLRLYFNYKIKLNKKMQIKAFYNWYVRDTETTAIPNKTYVSDEKDYNQNMVGLEFLYNFKL